MSKLSRRIAVSVLAIASVGAIAPAASAKAVDNLPPLRQPYYKTDQQQGVISPYGDNNVVCYFSGDRFDQLPHQCWQKRSDGKWQELYQLPTTPYTPTIEYYPIWEDPAALGALPFAQPIKDALAALKHAPDLNRAIANLPQPAKDALATLGIK